MSSDMWKGGGFWSLSFHLAEGKLEPLPAMVAELVRTKVDVIVTGGPSATRAAKEASSNDSHCHGDEY